MFKPKDEPVRRSEIDALRDEFEQKLRTLESRALGRGLDEELRRMGAKIDRQNPVFHNYLASLLREYEVSLLNVKQMGYYIGLQEMARTGIAGRLSESVAPLEYMLSSKLCTQKDCESDWYIYWLQKLQSGFTYHRKLWEFCYIAQQLYAGGALKEGKSGLGFGCGEEPLPSLWALFGASACGTDLDPRTSSEAKSGWIEAGAHSTNREKLLHRNICPDEQKLARISHEFVDMNFIPAKFDGQFDFCWSSCAFEHVGSIEKGLTFIENSMKVLKPGGISVHTTEFNLDDGETLDNWATVLFQKRHMEDLLARLTRQGYIVSPFDFDGGSGVLDGLFDIPPWPWEVEKLGWRPLYCYTHLKKSIEGIPCTSIGITVRKPS